jgi:hypothetical protein
MPGGGIPGLQQQQKQGKVSGNKVDACAVGNMRFAVCL